MMSITRYAVAVFRNMFRLSCSSCVMGTGADAGGAAPAADPFAVTAATMLAVAGSRYERAFADSEACALAIAWADDGAWLGMIEGLDGSGSCRAPVDRYSLMLAAPMPLGGVSPAPWHANLG